MLASDEANIPYSPPIAVFLKRMSIAISMLRMAKGQCTQMDPILIKQYGGQRLYDTAAAIYVSPIDLTNMILNHQRFTVQEAETGNDITLEILNRLDQDSN